LFGASILSKVQVAQQIPGLFRARDVAQIVRKRLPFVRKASLYKRQKVVVNLNRQLDPLAGSLGVRVPVGDDHAAVGVRLEKRRK